MNDYDASSVWDYEISAHDLVENHAYNMQDTYDLDEEYARDYMHIITYSTRYYTSMCNIIM